MASPSEFWLFMCQVQESEGRSNSGLFVSAPHFLFHLEPISPLVPPSPYREVGGDLIASGVDTC